jgi:RimJ/RimL family protein N-acetyltransferase
MMIETKRLLLEKISLCHLEPLFHVFGDPEVMKYWYGGADEDIEETRRRIFYLEDHWSTFGFGDWSIINKVNSCVIGFAGLHYIKDVPEVNIGYAFAQSVWRRGYAYEACSEILSHGFGYLDLEQIIAVIWPQNQASINLATKCGLTYWKQIKWKGSKRVVYSIRCGTKRSR